MLHNPRLANIENPSTWEDFLASQWHNPSDILSVLLLLGPDVVRQAIAQLNGRFITPVAFSFGWVAYAVSALLSIVGDGKLMPDVNSSNTLTIAATSGHQRVSQSWVLNRLLRDSDERYDEEMRDEQGHTPPGMRGQKSRNSNSNQKTEGVIRQRSWEALRVSIYEPYENTHRRHGLPIYDWVWFSGAFVIIIQLVIGMLPWIINGEWATFLVAAVGNTLALIGGSIPQWREEKWACPKNGGSTITLTRGNGSRHAVVILRKRGVGLDLEVLANSTRTSRSSLKTKITITILAFLWIVLLITVAGLKSNTWYLLGIGLLGSMQNLIAAGAPRNPSALGVHIKHIETITGASVADVLKELEQKYQFAGTSLLEIFFPGGLRVKGDDIDFWHQAKEARLASNRHGTLV